MYKSPRTRPNHRSKMAEVHAMPPISHESSDAERFGENHNDERINSQEDYYEDYRQVRINGRLIDADWEYGEERQYHDIDDYDYPSEDDRDPLYDESDPEDHPTPINNPINNRERRNPQQRWVNEDRQARDAVLAAPPQLYVATKAENGQETCFICMGNKPDSAFDCGHSGVCCVCADTLLKTTKKCPLCRAPFTSFSVTEESSDKDGDSDASDDL